MTHLISLGQFKTLKDDLLGFKHFVTAVIFSVCLLFVSVFICIVFVLHSWIRSPLEMRFDV